MASTAPTKVHTLSLTLPVSDTSLRLHLTAYSHALVLYIVPAPSGAPLDGNAGGGGAGSGAAEADAEAQAAQMAGAGSDGGFAMGSFVLGMVDVTHRPSNTSAKPAVHTTALLATPSTHDLATRLARILAGRARKPAYVGVARGLRFWSVEDEGAFVRGAVEGVLERVGG